MSFTKNKLLLIVKSSLKKLRNLDKKLLEINVNERTITHKLAEYLQQNFPELNVDCEYNRFEGNATETKVKRLNLPTDNINWDDTEAKTIFPDIIVHKRGSRGKNILVIEVKKSSSTVPEVYDRNKLIAFTEDPYNYELGLFLKIGMEDSEDTMDWYSNGVRTLE